VNVDSLIVKTASSLCGSLYDYTGSPKVAWRHYDDGSDSDQICWSIARVGDLNFIVLRGSETFIDWWRDFDAWSDPFHKLNLGHVHPGFYLGMEQVWAEAKPLVGPKVVVTGHSLGAARASILCGIMALDGCAPTARVVLAEPKPGFSDFAQLIAPIPSVAFCNGDDEGHDLVTDAPLSFPPEEYVHPTPFTRVRSSPPANDKLGIFAYHHWYLYDAAIQAASNP
jgi:hypothetical protein